MNIVQVERRRYAINTVVTSREAILAVCRELLATKGAATLNMRAVAAQCGVALGSLYNYFPSKSDLLAATVASIWQEIFGMDHCPAAADFPGQVQWFFDRAQNGARQYPHFFSAHPVAFSKTGKAEGRRMMEQYFAHIKAGLLASLAQDPGVQAAVFTPDFTRSDFVDFVFDHLLVLLGQEKTDCAPLLAVLRRVLYAPCGS